MTPEGYRYADCELDASGTQLFCVREDHTDAGEPKNAIVAVPTAGGSAGTVLFGESAPSGRIRASDAFEIEPGPDAAQL